MFDGGTCPCSYTLASDLTPVVLFPSSINREGQPGRCPRTGSRAVAVRLAHPKWISPAQGTVLGRQAGARTIGS